MGPPTAQAFIATVVNSEDTGADRPCPWLILRGPAHSLSPSRDLRQAEPRRGMPAIGSGHNSELNIELRAEQPLPVRL